MCASVYKCHIAGQELREALKSGGHRHLTGFEFDDFTYTGMLFLVLLLYMCGPRLHATCYFETVHVVYS